MTGEVRIARLRLHAGGADPGGLDGYAAARALDLDIADADHSVLVLKRLSVPAADRGAARDRVRALRTSARRPARERVEPGCQAVLFQDEAEALACLSADLVAARASEQWYWPATVRAASASPATALARLWLGQARWVPAALGQLARSSPSTAIAAVGLLPEPGARAVLDAVLAAFHGPGPALSPGPDPARRPESGRGPADADEPDPAGSRPAPSQLLPDAARATRGSSLGPAGRTLLAVALTLAANPAAARHRRLGLETCELLTAAPEEATPEETAGPSGRGAAPVGGKNARANLFPAGDGPPGAAVPQARVPDGAAGPGHEPGHEPDHEPGHKPGHGSGDQAGDEALGPGFGPARPGGEDAGPAISSRFASVLYAVNLMDWLGLPRTAAPGRAPEMESGEMESGWATVEALARWLLRPRGAVERRDPVWRALAALDGRPEDEPARVRLGGYTRRARLLLDRHGISPGVFARPGLVITSRTHVDVVLGIDQIDLAARASGLDQNPGWVPVLGRIVSFHFDGGN